MNYVLISFYKRGEKWDVYGHRSFGDNDSLGTFEAKEEAIVFAHKQSCRCPVVEGTGEWIGHKADRLACEWISVKQKLPAIGEEVLVYCPDHPRYRVTALARFKRHQGACDYHWDNYYGKGNMHLQTAVSHWMPLPGWW